MKFCEACGQPMPDPARLQRITAAELDALSAWWWAKSARGAARVLGLSEQTVKNELWTARRRHGLNKTLELAQMFFGQLRSLEELMQHNRERPAA